jgi:hypothetical protein
MSGETPAPTGAGFRDTIENRVGISRLRFETFTLGTLVVIALIGIAGYIAGADVRRARADVPWSLPAPYPLRTQEWCPRSSERARSRRCMLNGPEGNRHVNRQ